MSIQQLINELTEIVESGSVSLDTPITLYDMHTGERSDVISLDSSIEGVVEINFS